MRGKPRVLQCPLPRWPGWFWPPFDPAWRDRLPYIVALVEFPDAPSVRLIANVAADPETLAIGMAVTPRFDDGAAIGKGGVTFVPTGNV